MTLKPGVFGHAQFDHEDGRPVARLRLDRWWDSTLTLDADGRPADERYRPLVIIGKNPSVASGDTQDNTADGFCTTFARREGANGLVMVNLHPGISTDPDGLCNVLLPHGCDERHWDAVRGALSLNAVAVVAGWGKKPEGLSSHADRVARVKRIATELDVALVCFGTNKDGSPRHPQYLKASTPLVPYWSGR